MPLRLDLPFASPRVTIFKAFIGQGSLQCFRLIPWRAHPQVEFFWRQPADSFTPGGSLGRKRRC
jgi:hypothetical protein